MRSTLGSGNNPREICRRHHAQGQHHSGGSVSPCWLSIHGEVFECPVVANWIVAHALSITLCSAWKRVIDRAPGTATSLAWFVLLYGWHSFQGVTNWLSVWPSRQVLLRFPSAQCPLDNTSLKSSWVCLPCPLLGRSHRNAEWHSRHTVLNALFFSSGWLNSPMYSGTTENNSPTLMK